MVAEHLDHLHYLNDILCLNIIDLNHVLTDHLLHKLLIPMYIYSLSSRKRRTSSSSTPKSSQNNSPNKGNEIPNGKISCVVALFLLSQVFLILSHSPLVQSLAWIILKTDRTVFEKGECFFVIKNFQLFRYANLGIIFIHALPASSCVTFNSSCMLHN